MKKIFILFGFFQVLIIPGCKKFLAIAPPADQLVNTSVFQNEPSATATVLGIYEKMMESIAYFANGGITLYTGFTSDELTAIPSNSSYSEFYNNQITTTNINLKTALWGSAYQILYQSNSVLEGLAGAPIQSSVKNQLTGEAKFIRAFCNFYLLNLFGNIPLVVSSDYTVNSRLTRSSSVAVYNQILKDLQDAIELLPNNYVDQNNQITNTQRVRPNKATANALLSRVYLYLKDWKDAESTANLLISQSDLYFLNSNLNQVFLAGSTESIWQLMPVIPNQNTAEGAMFVQTTGNPLYGFLDSGLLTSFEPSDQRAVEWIASYMNAGNTFYYPAKYKINSSPNLAEYYTVFRIAEIYLIRAEARNEQQNITGAAADLNVIRERAGLPQTEAADYASMQMAVENERRHELFCEWGHRWMDLKRTGRIDVVLSANKSSWQPTDSLFPIPQTEIQNDGNLTQNSGY